MLIVELVETAQKDWFIIVPGVEGVCIVIFVFLSRIKYEIKLYRCPILYSKFEESKQRKRYSL